jgi:2-polyprenyl-3-methyl-5-hydroxy-6-metoxy-1,4-benzoquinol methylase
VEVEAYRAMAEVEADYWWYRSRRELCLRQVERAAEALGHPTERLTLLDYGCGTGYNLPLLARFGTVYGADEPSAPLQPFVKYPEYPRIDLTSGAGEHANRFNIITLLDVLEHIEDDVGALRSLRKLLMPARGQIVITAPAYQWLWGDEDVLSRHFRRYTKQSLVETCRAAGFEVLFLSYFNLSILPMQAAVVWARQLFASAVPARTNLQPLPRLVNELLFRLTSVEARAVGGEHGALPAGTSLVARIRPLPGVVT